MGKKKLQKLYTLAGRKHERDESGEFYIKYNYNGFLLANDRYKTKMKPEDLPDSFIFISGGGVHHGFLDAAGVIDLKYVPNLWINYFLKDDCLVISYTGKIGNEEKHYCFENEDQCIYGNSILYFLEGARKYSGIDITPIIEQLKNKVQTLKQKHPEQFGNFKFDVDDWFSHDHREDNHLEAIHWENWIRYCCDLPELPVPKPHQ